MSDPTGFKRCDGYVGSVPQNFINANLPTCPMCGTHDPYWTLKDKMEFTAHRIMFRCDKCGAILSATQMDFTGMTKSGAAMWLTTAGGVNALVKKKEGKDIKTVYMRIEDVGDMYVSRELEGKELPIDEVKAMAAAHSNAPQAPQYAAPQQAAPQPQVQYAAPQPQVQYASPQQAAPQPQVQYAAPQQAAPQPQVQYAAPQQAAPQPQVQYAAPQPAPQYRAAAPAASKPSMLALIFAMVFAFGKVIGFFSSFIRTLEYSSAALSLFSSMIALGGIAMIILDMFMYNKREKRLFTAIGFFALAFAEMFSLSGFYWWASLLIFPAYGLVGAYFLLDGKLFGNPIKLICSIVVMAIRFISLIVMIADYPAFMGVILNMMSIAIGVTMLTYNLPKKA